ncbi:hypothetical protein ACH5RR_035978 [Cinchona calisaya]|uniref:Uncharacterized protein n=1 Tax=Cinchona calisaya TaxID=153742 RepID=A0ABD2Y6P7_9GENT
MGKESVLNLIAEKFKELWMAIENFWGQFLGWFDKVFPPETRADKLHHWLHIALIILIVVVLLSCVYYCCKCCCCGKGRVKMMKAPGRKCMMPRHIFASNPKSYFSNLRAYPGKVERNSGADEMMTNLHEKLKELRLMVENSGYFSMGWLDKVFPPETRQQHFIPPWLLHDKAPFVVSGLAGLLLFWYCCSSTKGGKTMKAPGRKNVRMRRNDFEANPKDIFGISMAANVKTKIFSYESAFIFFLLSSSDSDAADPKILETPHAATPIPAAATAATFNNPPMLVSSS